MNTLAELVSQERVVCRTAASSKKKVLELVSELLVRGNPALTEAEVFASLLDRERLGSTGLGHGVAIPHGRLSGIERPLCAFVKLAEGVDYDAADEQPVDMICALLVPKESTDEHLNILAVLADLFSDRGVCELLRGARTDRELYALLTSWRPAGLERAAGPSG